jgi:hypothetical protein
VLPYRRGLRPGWLLRIGLLVYDHLGERKLLPPTRVIDLARDPAGVPLKPGLFHTGFEFSDCRVDGLGRKMPAGMTSSKFGEARLGNSSALLRCLVQKSCSCRWSPAARIKRASTSFSTPARGALCRYFDGQKFSPPVLAQPRLPRNRRRLWANAKRAAEALELLHSQSVIHRNIDPWAVITDFGEQSDFRLTGFEWSMRLAASDSPLATLKPSDGRDGVASFGRDWTNLGILVDGIPACCCGRCNANLASQSRHVRRCWVLGSGRR